MINVWLVRSEVGPNKLKSRCQPGCFLSGNSMEESLPGLLQELEVICIPWLMAPSSSSYLAVRYLFSILIVFYYLCYYSCPTFFPLCPPPSSPHSGNPITIAYVHGSYIYVLWWIPSPYFIPLPSSSCQSVLHIYASVSILLVSFVN